MKTTYKAAGSLLLAAALLSSCKKGPESNILEEGNYKQDTAGTTLKAAAGTMPFGLAIENALYTGNSTYQGIVDREASSVTFGNELKYGSVVQNNGTFNFTTADALVSTFTTKGIAVYGHVLGWHSQQNGTYLKNYAGIVVAAATELYTNNAGFENGLTGWGVYNTNGATITANTGVAGAETHTGTGSMKVVNPTAQTGNQWKVQVSSAAFATVPGKTYAISYWVKAASGSGSIRLSSGPTAAQYQGDQTFGTSWTQITWNITATLTSTTFLFDMGQLANTYFIDDVSVKEVVAAPSGAQIAAKLDTALNSWITAAVTRYKGKIKAWDVINEAISPTGAYRTSVNSTDIPDRSTNNNYLFWSDYLGRDYPLKAFNYAKAADPAALLFINDFGLESSAAKTDSLIGLVKELQGKGAKIDGIGTQMHIDWNTSYLGIDQMMQKLAATGLLIRISELDVRVNPLSKVGFAYTQLDGAYQASMYKYVVQSYLRYIPKAQQYGITVWGVDDRTSWLYKNGTDFPDLYDVNYGKKPAYGAVVQGLQGK